jgi:hypothetical protein
MARRTMTRATVLLNSFADNGVEPCGTIVVSYAQRIFYCMILLYTILEATSKSVSRSRLHDSEWMGWKQVASLDLRQETP